RRAVSGDGASRYEPDALEERETLLELPPSELVRFGLIDNRGLLVVAAVLGFLGQSGYFRNMEGQPPPWVELLPWDRLFGLGGAAPVLVGLLVSSALLAGTRLLSVMLALITLYGFRLTRSGDDLHTRFGLLTRVSLTLRRRRVQAVHQTATWLHRLFRRVSLRVDL